VVNSLLWTCAAVMLRLITPCRQMHMKGTQMPINKKLWLHTVNPNATLNYYRSQHNCKIIWEEHKTRDLDAIFCYCRRRWQHLGYLNQRRIDPLWSRENAIQFTGR
jgi:hypothetical protein